MDLLNLAAKLETASDLEPMEFHLYVIEILLFAGKQRTIIQHYENLMDTFIFEQRFTMY